MEPGNRRRILRALEVCEGSGRPFSSYGPGLDRYPPTPFVLVGVGLSRDTIDRRIDERYADQLAAGFVAEVARLREAPGGLSPTARQALGYREVLTHLEEGEPLDESIERARARTRQFARRQERWFRRDPRIRWHDAEDNPMALLPSLLRDWPPCS
jgi:tRNA dimethylallyltransferase